MPAGQGKEDPMAVKGQLSQGLTGLNLRFDCLSVGSMSGPEEAEMGTRM